MTLTTLISDARFYALGNSSSTAYSDTDVTRNINKRYHEGIILIFQSNGDWQISGDYATTDIVAGQSEYVLDNANILKVHKVLIKPTSSDNYQTANKINIIDVDESEGTYHPSTPEYDLYDNSLFIYLPNDIGSVTAGIKIYYQKEITELTGTATPIIAKPFHRYITIGAAIDYCIAFEMWNKLKALNNELEMAKREMQEFYSNRAETTPLKFTVKLDDNY